MSVRHQVSPRVSHSRTIPLPSSPTHPGPSIQTDSRSEGSLMEEIHDIAVWQEDNQPMPTRVASIDMVPDDVLLVIFDFYSDASEYPYARSKKEIEAWWQTLVHVCRRWRTVVFGSPRRLNLRLACSPETPVRDMLDVWPALPLAFSTFNSATKGRLDSILAVLEQRHRVCQIRLLDLTGLQMGKVLTAMQVPFPELTDLVLQIPSDDDWPAVPDSFLGGSAPLLRTFFSFRMPFPGLPKLFSSSAHLADLQLSKIPHSGYFSPETLLTALSVCTNLYNLSLTFQSPRSCPDQARRRPPPSERTVLPVLTILFFAGAMEYLEDLMAGIDAPLNDLGVCPFNDIVLDAPQLVQFISRTPTLQSLENADVSFMKFYARIVFSSQTPNYRQIRVDLTCSGSEWQASLLEEVCTSLVPLNSKLGDLSVTLWDPARIDNVENTQWLDLLRPFTAVKKLELSEQVARSIVPALQELVGDRTTEVLPALQNVVLEGLKPGPVQEGIQQFVAARQATGHSITVN